MCGHCKNRKGSTSRIASTYYNATDFTIDLNLTDGEVHKISLYFCDWDNGGRDETISIVDAASRVVLSSLPLASFYGGLWEVWEIKGHVQIQAVHTGGSNGVVNGLFFN